MGREGLIHPNKMVCSNVAVDLNTGIEELPASPSASFLAHSGAGVDFARSPAPPILTTPHSAPPCSRRPPSELYRPAVSLARSDPLHPNFNCNLDLNEHNSGDNSTASVRS